MRIAVGRSAWMYYFLLFLLSEILKIKSVVIHCGGDMSHNFVGMQYSE